MSHIPEESWEKEFDGMYEAKLLNEYGSLFKKAVKDFIRKLLAEKEARVMKIILKYEPTSPDELDDFSRWDDMKAEIIGNK
jgi:hypothetical protein